jgi:YihY family inner membrane protein
MSASLSFNTMFATVPVLVLAVLMMKSLKFMDGEDAKEYINNRLNSVGLSQIELVSEPTDAPIRQGDSEPDDALASLGDRRAEPLRVINVAEEVNKIVEHVESRLTLGRLGPAGAALLIFTSFNLLRNFERSLNRLFGSGQKRTWGRRLTIYWSVLTLGPILVGAASFTGDTAIEWVQSQGIRGALGLQTAIILFGPGLVGVLVVAFLYMFVPTKRTPFRAAFAGALTAVPLWMTAKWAFKVYLVQIVGGGSIYGALGLVPLFFIWINLSWAIFLMGATVAYAVSDIRQMRAEEQAVSTVLTPSDYLAAAVAVAIPHLNGDGPVQVDDVRERIRLPDRSVHRLLERLAASGVICRVATPDGPAYVLAKAADRIGVVSVLETNDPIRGSALNGRYSNEVAENVRRIRGRIEADLGSVSLAELIAGEADSSRPQ